MADEEKLGQVIKSLDPGHALSIEMTQKMAKTVSRKRRFGVQNA